MKAKLFAILVIALFALSTFGIAGFAATTEKISITDVNYEDPVSPGATLPVDIELSNTDMVKDFQEVQVKAWLADGFGDRVGDKVAIGPMQIQQDAEKTVTLNLNVPADAGAGDYKLMIEASGVWEKGTTRITITPATENIVEVEQNTDSLFVQDIRTAKTEYSAGDSVDTAVTVMNNGADDQSNVVVSVAVPEYGIEKSIKLFGTLFAGNSETIYFTFALPKDAEGGIHTLTATASDSVTKASSSIDFVIKKPIVADASTNVKGTTVKLDDLDVNEAETFQLAVSNKDIIAKSYEISANADWAAITASPTKFDLRPGQAQTVTITVTAEQSGEHSADVLVLENGKAISSVTIEANANAETSMTTTGAVIAALAVILAAVIVYFQFYRNGGSKAKSQHIYY